MAAQAEIHSDSKYFNREISWLGFCRGVLEQAQNDQYPLLERLRYLSFVSSNLDEFFEIRVAGLMQQVDSGITETSIDGMTPDEQLKKILHISGALVEDQYKCWREKLLPTLKKEGVYFKKIDQLSKKENEWLNKYFEEQIYPVLTPLAIDQSHPFPQLTNKALYILVSVEGSGDLDNDNLAIIPVPRILPRVIPVKSKAGITSCYIFLSEVLRGFAEKLFPGYKVKEAWEFRITRNSDLYIDEEEVENLLSKIEEELYNMRRGASVRLEIRKNVHPEALKQLLEAINLRKESVFLIDGPLNLMRLISVYNIVDKPHLKFDKFLPHIPKPLGQNQNIFTAIKNEDFLLHHPFDSFSPIVEFINQAAIDPKVFAIKQTLYRTSGESPVVNALKQASFNGKQVTALIELKARFDEANNIAWAKELEEAGVHVVYGMPGLKTHCKCCLVVRREQKGLTRYVHIGTGNYNPKTAKTYTDISLLTANPQITNEVAELFNILTGFVRTPKFKNLLIAPFNLHNEIQKLIKKETTNAKKGLPAKIVAKLNNLSDQETIDNLYKASEAGVSITLIVRSICSLKPKKEGLSKNIEVRSILGRFFEHSRIYYFENGNNSPVVYAGSADWLPRNFFRRIEAVFPILAEPLKNRIIQEILPAYTEDTENARILSQDGVFKQKKGLFSAQKVLLSNT